MEKTEAIEMEKIECCSSDNPRPWQSYHTVYTNAKAGMDGVDKEKVQRTVYEMSKGSKYFENEEKKEAFMRHKIEKMRAQCAKLTPSHISHYQKIADRRVVELESTRDLTRIWLHIDMDAFYAAVETLSDPSLKGKPMAVGSMSMISTANYEARKFGVRAAMPGFIARKLCPELIFVPTDFKKYTHYSDLTRKVFSKYDPNFMACSLDEAYLDITNVCKERAISGSQVAEELRAHIYEETGLTCSAGVAPNRLLAKVCSDINKPNGQFVLQNDRTAVITFIASLPIRKIGGIGKVTECVLRDVLGINTCEEMLQKSTFLCALFSPCSADFFLSVGLGLGGTEKPEAKFRKSISTERTFSATSDEALLYKKLADIAEVLCADMQKEGLSGRTLTLKLKTASFEVRSRAMTLQKYICSSADILKYASKLLKAELPVSLRLIGVRISHFGDDKVGVLSDRSQRTLTNFIAMADCKKSQRGHDSEGPNVSAVCLMTGAESTFSTDSNDSYHELRDQLDINSLEDLSDHHYTLHSNCEVNEIHEPLSSEIVAKLNDAESSRSKEPEASSTDMGNKKFMNDETLVTSGSADLLTWVDGYKCSICGTEMPLDFVEERQEHRDFHLAERLEKEESGINSRTSLLRQRSVLIDPNSSQRKRKKCKASPKPTSDLSIDMFFARRNQNI